MNDVYDPFLLPSSLQNQVNEQVYNELMADVLCNIRPLDDLLDLISDSKEDPDKFLAGVVDELNFVVDAGIRFKTNDSGLFLPERYQT